MKLLTWKQWNRFNQLMMIWSRRIGNKKDSFYIRKINNYLSRIFKHE